MGLLICYLEILTGFFIKMDRNRSKGKLKVIQPTKQSRHSSINKLNISEIKLDKKT